MMRKHCDHRYNGLYYIYLYKPFLKYSGYITSRNRLVLLFKTAWTALKWAVAAHVLKWHPL